MLLPLMLLAADPETAVEAERAFNRAAQTEGQWAAFRSFSTPDAIWFTPQPVKVHETLPDKEPSIAVQWWAAESYVSCDGSVAVNTGPWVRPKGNGYFTTVWVRQTDGRFKWVVDGGDALATPRALPAKPKVRKAACSGQAFPLLDAVAEKDVKAGSGHSTDWTLSWFWMVRADGSRRFTAHIWNGSRFESVVSNDVAAPPK